MTSLTPRDLQVLRESLMKFRKCYENIKGSFTCRESEVTMCNLKNAGIHILSEIDVENIYFSSLIKLRE